MKEIQGNGRQIGDAEMSGAIWAFGEGLLSIQNPSGTATQYTVRKVEDERGTALRLESSGPIAENGWMAFRMNGQWTRV